MQPDEFDYPIVVGNIKLRRRSYKDHIYWSYRDVRKDVNGWVNCDIFLPLLYDLCYIKDQNERILTGWFTGQQWDGLNLRENQNIKYWKKIDENP